MPAKYSTNEKKLKNNEFPVKPVLEKSNDTGISSAITAISPIQTKLGVNRSIIKEQICLHHINRPEDLTPLNITSYQCAAKVFSVDEIFTFLIVRRNQNNKLKLRLYNLYPR